MFWKTKIKKYIYIAIFVLTIFFVMDTNSANAAYVGCEKKIIGTNFYDCGNFVYTYPEDREHSSKLYAKDYTQRVVYAGEKDGYSVFYTNGLRYYNVTYDDRSSENNNIWSNIVNSGELLFDGSFEDTWLLDESHEGFFRDPYILKNGTYVIRQYHNDGKEYRKIIVYSVMGLDSNKYKANIKNFVYDGEVIESNSIKEVLDLKRNLSIYFDSAFGIESISIKINGTEINEYVIEGNLITLNNKINSYFKKGEVNSIAINAKNYLGVEVNEIYRLNVLNNSVSIEFSSISSQVVSSSRRILISAHAGIGKNLDTDYCWYYWSKNPDDSLEYGDFLINYANSKYKGSYSQDKGVILRNTTGTYYLYALAKDSDSTIVVRSDGYKLNDTGFSVNYDVYDAILVVSLLILAIVPISIYLFVRRKGY